MKGLKSAITAGLFGACLCVMPAAAGSTGLSNMLATGAAVPMSAADPIDMQGRRGGGFGAGGGGGGRIGAGGGGGGRIGAGGGGGGRIGAGGGGGRGGFAGGRGGRGGFRGGGGGGGAAAVGAAIGILGAAIIASEAARASAPRECWIERRRIRDEWGRTIGVRRVRICR